MDSTIIYRHLHEHYGSTARAQKSEKADGIAQAFGYTTEELKSIPSDANLGLSCGNPLAIASLREGETVVDLGCGAGFDVFLAAKQVGATGRAIGIDMNEDMLSRARRNHESMGKPSHISFIQGQITALPLENGIADCVISNCVVNLVPEAEKTEVFAEMARVLKPGGRVAISDILAKKPFPTRLRESVAAYVGCVAGCSPKEDYERWLHDNGFDDILLVDTQNDLNVYTKQGDNSGATCCSRSSSESTVIAKDQADSCCIDTQPCDEPLSLVDIDINEWVGSYKMFAVKK